MKKPDIKIPELLFVLYFYGFVMLKPILLYYKNFSTTILSVYSLILLLLLFIYKMKNRYAKANKEILYFIAIALFIASDAILRNNTYSFKYLYQFAYSGILPIVFLTYINTYDALIKYYSIFSAAIFLVFALDPIYEYAYFGNYMEFGFNLCLPTFYGIYLGYYHTKSKILFIISLLCLIDIILFANRSAAISVIIFLFIININKYKKQIKTRALVLVIILISIITQFNSIIDTLYRYLSKNGMTSYSITNYYQYIKKVDSHMIFSGRMNLWKDALGMIYESPFIGHGLGSYQAKYISYSHNIILDVLIDYGLIGILLFTTLIIGSIISINKSRSYQKHIGLLFLLLWFPKLIFSSYLYQESGFWCFIYYGLFLLANKPFILRQQVIKTVKANYI